METIANILGGVQIALQLAAIVLALDSLRHFRALTANVKYIAPFPLVVARIGKIVLLVVWAFGLMAARRITALAITLGVHPSPFIGTLDRVALPFVITALFFLAVLYGRLAIEVYLNE